MKVGIIGGGVAGLGAAYELLKHGHQVALYERAPFLGGLASTFEVGGGRLERFYHHLFTSDRTIIGLLHELGLGERLIWMDSKVGFFYGGKIYDFSTPMDLLRFKPVSLSDRIRMGLATLYLQQIKDWKKLESHTAASYIRRLAGQRNYEVIWGPLLRGKFTVYAEEVGMPWLWAKFGTRLTSRQGRLGKERLAYIRGSWQALIDTLEQRIREMGGEVHIGAGVDRVLTADGRAWGLRVRGADGTAQERPFDTVLACIPTFALPRLADLPEDYLKKLQSIHYEGAVAVIWVLKHPLSHIYWLNVADPEVPFLIVLEQTNFVPPSDYGGKHIAYTANYVTQDDWRWKADEQTLVRTYLEGLKKINPTFDESWVEAHYLHKEPAAQPIITTHYSQRIPPFETGIRGLYLASMAQIYPVDRGTNYSIQLGQEVARLAMQDAQAGEL